MPDDEQLKGLQAEEKSRGTKRPIRALSRERERQLRRIEGLLKDPRCDFNIYVETIRKFGLQADAEK